MSLTPDNARLLPQLPQPVQSAWSKVTELVGSFRHRSFLPEQPLASLPGIDPHFILRAPMSNANLDLGLLAKLSNMGLKRGKEITAATHPELYREWQLMSARAGMGNTPQLILAESKSPNAMSVHGEDAVVMTTELLRRLNAREVRAVLGHELAHESSDHTTPRLAALGVFGIGGALVGDHLSHQGGIGSVLKIGDMKPSRWKNFLQATFEHSGKQLSLLGSAFYVFAGFSAGSIVANQLSVRPTELDADRKGAAISGDPLALVSALTKLEESRAKNPLLRWYRKIESGYPSMETRKDRLREMARNMPQPPLEAPIPSMGAPLAAAPGVQVSGISDAARVAAPQPELAKEL